jgi:DNA-binding MarR family transcriptional regulator
VPTQRLPIGQLLVRHLRLFREQAMALVEEGGAGSELRVPHLHVMANMRRGGVRLTELAAAAGMTRPSMLELVDELEDLGLVERRSDPSDRRAKLIVLTPAGRRAIRTGRALIDRVEADYARRLGPERFEAMCQALQDLLDDLSGEVSPPRAPAEAGSAS